MGFESFQVRLRDPHIDADAIDAYLLSQSPVARDHDALRIGDSRYYVWADAEHVIEIELDCDSAQLSTRFTLCNPESIAAVFSNLLLRLHDRFGGRLVIADEVPPGRPSEFTHENRAEFQDVLNQSIVARRAEWVAHFGPRVLAAKSQDVYREFILPRCEPIADSLAPASIHMM